jgi:hypothetical protein
MSQVGLEFIARNRAQGEMARFNRSLVSMRRSLLRIVGLSGGIYGVQRALRSITSAYIVQERAEMALAAALRNTDGQYRENLKSMKAFAAELQKQTIYGDELILSQMAYGRNLGIVTHQLEDATVAAVGLAAKYRLDLSAAMMLVGRASQGQTQMLTRYGIILSETLTDQEKFNELLRIGADAFTLAQAETETAGGRLQQMVNRWGDVKEVIAGKGGVIDAFEDLMDVIEDYGPRVVPILVQVTSAMLKLVEVWDKTRDFHVWLMRLTGAPADLIHQVSGSLDFGGEDVRRHPLSRLTPNEQIQRMADLFGTRSGLEGPEAAGGGGVGGGAGGADMSDVIKQRVRDVQDFIRNAHYLTRTEKIAYLKDFQAEHAATLEDVTEAERALNNEIMMLERSRLDQMKVYFAEMRENAQSAYLFQMEAAAAYNRQVRSDFGSMWDPFIDGSQSAEEAMKSFFQDLFLNLAKAQAQMAMLQLWDQGIGPAFGGLGQMLFGATAMHGGGVAGRDGVGRIVAASAFAGANRYHKGLASDEFPAILQEGERVRPAGAGPEIVIDKYIERVDATDQASFDAQLYRSRQTLGDLSIMGNRSNHPTRRGGRG